VTDLEKQVEAMKALLNQSVTVAKVERAESSEYDDNHNTDNSHGSVDGHGCDASRYPTLSNNITQETHNKSPNTKTSPQSETSTGNTDSSFSLQGNYSAPGGDVIDRRVLNIDQAEFLFRTYNEHLVYHYPLVIFKPEMTMSLLRATKPTLFLAIMAAASSKYSPRLYNLLYKEIISTYAHRTIICGEKSVELVQAMLITCVWYNPPGTYALLKCYEYIHMTISMVSS
jgi:hypothetical protein